MKEIHPAIVALAFPLTAMPRPVRPTATAGSIPRGYNYVRRSLIFGTAGQMWEETLAPSMEYSSELCP